MKHGNYKRSKTTSLVVFFKHKPSAAVLSWLEAAGVIQTWMIEQLRAGQVVCQEAHQIVVDALTGYVQLSINLKYAKMSIQIRK